MVDNVEEDAGAMSPDLYEEEPEAEPKPKKTKGVAKRTDAKKTKSSGTKRAKKTKNVGTDKENKNPDQEAESKPDDSTAAKKTKAGAKRTARAGSKRKNVEVDGAGEDDAAELDDEVAAVTSKRSSASPSKLSSKMKKRDSAPASGNRKQSKAPAKKSTRKSKRTKNDPAEMQLETQESEEEDAHEVLAEESNAEDDTIEIEADDYDEDGKKYLAYMSGDADLGDMCEQAINMLGTYQLCSRRNGTIVPDVFVIGSKPRRTGRVLMALAAGSWVVHSDWVLSSISSGSWQDPESFEATDVFAGAHESRQAYEKSADPIFEKKQFGIVGVPKMPKKELKSLIEICGATLNNDKFDFLIVCPGASDKEVKSKSTKESQNVTERWFFDCIQNWSVGGVPNSVTLKQAMKSYS